MKRKRLSAEETAEAFQDMVNKGARSLTPKIQKGKRWLKRIAAVFFILLSIPLFLTGARVVGFGVLVLGLYFFAGGFFSDKIEKIAGCTLFVLGGLVFGVHGYTVYQNGVASENWPTAEGTVIQSEIKKSERTTGTGSSKRTEVRHIPQVAYTYTVDGQSYRSSRITFGAINALNAGATVNRYPKGKSIEVFYDPKNPDEAVLQPGAQTTSSIFFMGLGAIFAVIGLKQLSTQLKRSKALSQAGQSVEAQ